MPLNEDSAHSDSPKTPQGANEQFVAREKFMEHLLQAIGTSKSLEIPLMILSLSVRDGLTLATRHGLDSRSVIVMMCEPRFVARHPKLFQLLLDRYHQLTLQYGTPSKDMRVFHNPMVEGKIDPLTIHEQYGSLFRKKELNQPQLDEDIVAYYAPFLKGRTLEAIPEKKSPLSRGEQHAESYLEKMKLVLEDAYYARPVLEFAMRHRMKEEDALHKVISEARFQKWTEIHAVYPTYASLKQAILAKKEPGTEITLAALGTHMELFDPNALENFASKNDVHALLQQVGLNPEDPNVQAIIRGQRYRPLELVAREQEKIILKNLEQELKNRLTARGFKSDQYALKWDDATKRFTIEWVDTPSTSPDHLFAPNKFRRITPELNPKLLRHELHLESGIISDEGKFLLPNGEVVDDIVQPVGIQSNNRIKNLQKIEFVRTEDEQVYTFNPSTGKKIILNGRSIVLQDLDRNISALDLRANCIYYPDNTVLNVPEGDPIYRGMIVPTTIGFVIIDPRNHEITYPDETTVAAGDAVDLIPYNGGFIRKCLQKERQVYYEYPIGDITGPHHNSWQTLEEPANSRFDEFRMTPKGIGFREQKENPTLHVTHSRLHLPDGTTTPWTESVITDVHFTDEGTPICIERTDITSKRGTLNHGRNWSHYDFIDQLSIVNGEPVYISRQDASDPKKKSDTYLHLPNPKVSQPFDEILTYHVDQGHIYFAASLDGAWHIYNENQEPVSEPFERIDYFKITKGFISIIGLQQGTVVVLHQDRSKEAPPPDRSFTPEEQAKVDLMTVVRDPTEEGVARELQKIDQMLQRDPSKAGRFREWIDRLSHSPETARQVTKTLETSPQSFLAYNPAHRDDLSIREIDQLLLDAFPEWKEKKEFLDAQSSLRGRLQSWAETLKSLFQGTSVTASEYLTPRTTSEILDGDPKTKGSEVLRLRESMDAFLATQILGRYDKVSHQWDTVPFPLATHLEEPTKETTLTIDVPNKMTRLALPLPLGSSFIPARLRGLTKKGKVVSLETTRSDPGQVVITSIPTSVKTISYSVMLSETPPLPTSVPPEDYRRFREYLDREYAGQLTERLITPLPPECEQFLASIVDLPPHEKVIAIERYVREIGHYDMENGEFSQQKLNSTPAERLGLMRERMEALKKSTPELKEKQFAGVCADFAILTTALLRQAGFPSGISMGFKPHNLSVTTADAHAISFALWPHKGQGFQLIPVDGTPGSGIPDMLREQLQTPSLEEHIEAQKQIEAHYPELAEHELMDFEKKIRAGKPIKELSNGELERIMNFILSKLITPTHTRTLSRVFEGLTFSPIHTSVRTYAQNQSTPNASLSDSSLDEIRQFIQQELAHERTLPPAEITPGAGRQLFEYLNHFLDRLVKEDPEHQLIPACEQLERIFTLMKPSLEPIEANAIQAVINYFRIKKAP